MKSTRPNTTTNSPRSARALQSGGTPQAKHEEVILDGSDREPVFSLNYVDHINVEITGAMYETRMPKISRNASGRLTVMPVVRLDDNVSGLLIVPALLCSWLERQDNYMGLRLAIANKGIDEETGIRKVGVRVL
jgi:hypothetical protein